MNSKKRLLLGLVSSLLLAVGLAKAAELADPLPASQPQQPALTGGTAPDCDACVPCSILPTTAPDCWPCSIHESVV